MRALAAMRSRVFAGSVYISKRDLLKYLGDGARDYETVDKSVADALRHIVAQIERVA